MSLRIFGICRDPPLGKRDRAIDVQSELGVNLRRRLREIDVRAGKRPEVMIDGDGAPTEQQVQPQHGSEGAVRRGIVGRKRNRAPEQFERLIVIEIARQIETAKAQFLAAFSRGHVVRLNRRVTRQRRENHNCDSRDWQLPVHKTMIVRCTYRPFRFGTRRSEMPRGRPRKQQGRVLLKSAELIGWAIGGIEREIAHTRERLAALTAQAAQLRQRAGVKASAAAASAASAVGVGESAGAGGKRRRRKMSPEARKKISEMMKKRWAERRKGK